MSEKSEVNYDPNSLRNTIRMALGDQWTRELEDKLFYPLAAFNDASMKCVLKEQLDAIHKVLGITEKLHRASMGFPILD